LSHPPSYISFDESLYLGLNPREDGRPGMLFTEEEFQEVIHSVNLLSKVDMDPTIVESVKNYRNYHPGVCTTILHTLCEEARYYRKLPKVTYDPKKQHEELTLKQFMALRSPSFSSECRSACGLFAPLSKSELKIAELLLNQNPLDVSKLEENEKLTVRSMVKKGMIEEDFNHRISLPSPTHAKTFLEILYRPY
jgi:hypothetical protein